MNESPIYQMRTIYRRLKNTKLLYRSVMQGVQREIDLYHVLTKPLRKQYYWKPLIPKRPKTDLNFKEELLMPFNILAKFRKSVKKLTKLLSIIERELAIIYYGFRPGILIIKCITIAAKKTTLIISSLIQDRGVQRVGRGLLSGYKLLRIFIYCLIYIRRYSYRSYRAWIETKKAVKRKFKKIRALKRAGQLMNTFRRIISYRPTSKKRNDLPERSAGEASEYSPKYSIKVRNGKIILIRRRPKLKITPTKKTKRPVKAKNINPDKLKRLVILY